MQFVVLRYAVNGEGEGMWKERLVSHFEVGLPHGHLFGLTDRQLTDRPSGGRSQTVLSGYKADNSAICIGLRD